jgi:hypothetical protein
MDDEYRLAWANIEGWTTNAYHRSVFLDGSRQREAAEGVRGQQRNAERAREAEPNSYGMGGKPSERCDFMAVAPQAR